MREDDEKVSPADSQTLFQSWLRLAPSCFHQTISCRAEGTSEITSQHTVLEKFQLQVCRIQSLLFSRCPSLLMLRYNWISEISAEPEALGDLSAVSRRSHFQRCAINFCIMNLLDLNVLVSQFALKPVTANRATSWTGESVIKRNKCIRGENENTTHA